MREKSVSSNEKDFASACIAEGLRLDGRKQAEARSVSVKLGPSWGFAEIHFDDSHAIAYTSVEAVKPVSDRPNEGTITISIELSPASSEIAAREALARSNTLHSFFETRATIESFVRESRAIDTEALCILAGVKVWAVRVAVDVINNDGNCTDVAVMAVMASLLHARRPDVTVTGTEVRVHTMDEREPVPLPVHHVPLAVTFSMFGGGKPHEGDRAILDPTKVEEQASSGTLSFAFNAQGEVCGVHKAGGLPLLPSTFAECATLGASRTIELTSILEKAMLNAASEHPLAASRPVLMNPEPSAVIRTNIIETDKYEQDVNMSTSAWNAMPLPDDMPPNIAALRGGEESLVGRNVEEALKEKVEKVDNTDKEELFYNEEVKEKRDVIFKEDLDDSEDESSGDDLEEAILTKDRKRFGRQK